MIAISFVRSHMKSGYVAVDNLVGKLSLRGVRSDAGFRGSCAANKLCVSSLFRVCLADNYSFAKVLVDRFVKLPGRDMERFSDALRAY